MLREWFDDQMRRMGDLKSPPSGLDAHYEALSDIPPDVLAQAIGHALKTRPWFPTPADLRADCDAVARRVRLLPARRRRAVNLADAFQVTIPNPFGGKGLVLTVTRDWHSDCDACDDTGWASRWCGESANLQHPDKPVLRCPNDGEHFPHEWVESCVCIDTNPTIRRRKEAQMKYAHAPERVS